MAVSGCPWGLTHRDPKGHVTLSAIGKKLLWLGESAQSKYAGSVSRMESWIVPKSTKLPYIYN